MLIDMIHDNHGEPPFKTRFRDPALLGSYGYEAVVIPDAIPALPTARRADEPLAHYRSIGELEAAIDARQQAAAAAGMKVFFYGDALLLPRHVVQPRASEFFCDDHSGRLCPGKPAVLQAHERLVRELFSRWPGAAGLIMRTGEVYPEATPHMVGNPLHTPACPTCRGVGITQRVVAFVEAMSRVVIRELGKTYVHRAWQPTPSGVPNMHDDPDVYLAVSRALPESPGLCFSFKFTRGDFRHGQPFNPCLAADSRPKWIEFQCEREFEGKGAIPNYQVSVWEAFLSDLNRRDAGAAGPPRANLSFWGWSRGGGWGGPYPQREEWIDANVFGLSQLYRSPGTPPATIAAAWAELALSVPHESAAARSVAEILALSRPAIEGLLYVRGMMSQQAWLKDDLIDVNAFWSTAMRVAETLPVAASVAAACQEKNDALAAVERMRRLFESIAPGLPNKSQARDLGNTLVYYNSLAGTIAKLFCGFARFIQWSRGGRTDTALAAQARDDLEHAQAHWQHHTQRHALLPGAPSVFQENAFWERTNECIEQLQG